MMDSYITKEKIQSSNTILFIAHLAIGDYTYLQNYFKELSKAYPHLKIDLFVDERRRTNNKSKWESLKKYSLYDWLEVSLFFRKIYKKNYRPDFYQQALQEIKKEHYDIIVSLATLSPDHYAQLVNTLKGENTYTAAMDFKPKFWQRRVREVKKGINCLIDGTPEVKDVSHHVTDDYHYWFNQLFGLKLKPEKQYPFVNIPSQWQILAEEELITLGADQKQKIFINSFAKNKKRSWKIEQALALIKLIQALPDKQETFFIINSIPEAYKKTKTLVEKENLKNIYLFSANKNFFQLPALLSKMDLIISVETSIMHLANAVNVPVIALMRQKTPEWRPIDRDNSQVIFTPKRRHHIPAITPEAVFELYQQALFTHQN